MTGFIGRRDRREQSGDPRLPPGQYDTGSTFPVLTAEVTPRIDPQTWSFRVDGLVTTPRTWTWDEVQQLPPSTYEGDIHCVTTWSKLGTSFTGVSLDVLVDQVGLAEEATHVVAWSSTGRLVV
jgi:DMSO/TMAO reductase YedYZ molybdopterin-dependent catalytic subunit